MGLPVAIPYVGDVDVGDLQTPPTGGATGAGAVIGAGVGTVVPGIGTAVGGTIGALIDELGSIVKGRTQTFDWETSKRYAEKISNQIAQQTQAAIPQARFDQLAQGYISFIENYLRSSTYWTKNGEAVRIANELRDDVHGLRGASGYKVVQSCIFLVSMWILTSSDRNRPEELPKFFKTHLQDAYTAFWSVDEGAVSLPAGPGASTRVVTTPQTQATTPEEQRTYLLIAGAVVLLLMTAFALMLKK